MRRAFVLLLALSSCSPDHSPREPAIRPEPEPAAHATAPEADRPVPPPAPEVVVPDMVPPDQTFRVLTLAEPIRLPRLRTRRVERRLEGDEYLYGEARLTWETALHPDAAARAAIASWAQENAASLLSDHTSAVRCELVLAHERAVVMACDYNDEDDRSGGQAYGTVFASRIEGGQLVTFDMRDPLVPRATFATAVAQRCQAAVARARQDDPESDVQHLECDVQTPRYAPGHDGLHARYDGFGSAVFDVRIPWGALTDMIRADGPLAAFLPTSGEPHEVTIPGSEQLEAELAQSCGVLLAVTEPLPLDDAMRAAMDVRTIEGERLGIALEQGSEPREEGRVVVGGCMHTAAAVRELATRAAEIASARHARAERVRYVAHDVRWVRVSEPLALRDGPRDGAVQMTLPTGAIVAAELGSIGGVTSSIGGQGRWARVFASRSIDGWAAGRYLAPSPRAPIEVSALLSALPSAVRAEAARNAIVGDRAPVGAAEPRWYAIAPVPSEPAVYVVVGDHAARAAGTVDEVMFIGDDAPHVLIATRVAGLPDGAVRWHLFAPGAATHGWTIDAPTSATLPAAQRATLATDVTHDHQRYLLEMRMPDHSVVRVRAEEGVFREERSAQ